MVVVIMSILAVLGTDAIAQFEASQRGDRAARESMRAFIAAREIARTTGKKTKVALDTSAGTLSVYWQSNGSTYDTTPVSNGMTSTGTWVLSMNNNRELVGTTIAVSNTSMGYTNYFEYSALGNCAQTGTVTFTYGGKTKSLVVPYIGDPQLQ